MINAILQAQADWWAQFANPPEQDRTEEELQVIRDHYREQIASHIENPEDLP